MVTSLSQSQDWHLQRDNRTHSFSQLWRIIQSFYFSNAQCIVQAAASAKHCYHTNVFLCLWNKSLANTSRFCKMYKLRSVPQHCVTNVSLSLLQHVENSGGQCVGCRFRGEESLAHYSPWSCGTIGPCLSPFEPEALTHTSAHSCSEHSVRLSPQKGQTLKRTSIFKVSASF